MIKPKLTPWRMSVLPKSTTKPLSDIVENYPHIMLIVNVSNFSNCRQHRSWMWSFFLTLNRSRYEFIHTEECRSIPSASSGRSCSTRALTPDNDSGCFRRCCCSSLLCLLRRIRVYEAVRKEPNSCTQSTADYHMAV